MIVIERMDSISGISALLTVSLTIERRIKLDIMIALFISVTLVTVAARFSLDGEWGVVNAVVKSHEI